MSFNARLSDIAEIIMGQSPKGDQVNDTGLGLPLLNGPTEFTARYPDPVQFTEHGKRFAATGDILFCVRGSTTGRMNYSDQSYAIGRGIGAIRGKNGFPTPYVRAILEHGLARLLQAATGSTFPNISRDTLANFEVNSVDNTSAGVVSQFLVSLEDKAYLNAQINQTLEQMAQAIFKSWFVDFEPVKAKMAALEAGGSEDDALLAAMQAIAGNALFASDAADADAATQLARLQAEHPEQYATLRATAELFPAAMQDSELGEIPEGWDVKSVESQFQITIGRTPPRKEPEWFSEKPEHVKWLSIKKMGEGNVFANDSDEYLTQEAVDKFKIKICPEGTVLLSFKLTLGRVVIAKKDMTTNEAIAHFRISAHSPGSYWTYLYLSQFDYSSLGSTSSIATAVNSKTIKQMPLITPDVALLQYFEKFVTPIFGNIYNYQLDNECLASLRDTLLPKLLSGELSVSAAADQITQAEEAVNVQS